MPLVFSVPLKTLQAQRSVILAERVILSKGWQIHVLCKQALLKGLLTHLRFIKAQASSAGHTIMGKNLFSGALSRLEF